jgi:prepilin-type processing-associated H-X9-DG protein
MTVKGAVWYADGHVAQSHHLPWTASEDVILGRGFIDRDLEGNALHRWCSAHGLHRSAGAIDRRLVELSFFDSKVPVKHYPVGRGQERGTMVNGDFAKQARASAAAELRNQIRLAKLEAVAGVPPFKPKDV